MKKLLALSVLLFGSLQAQNLDSLYSEFLRIKGVPDPTNTRVLGDNTEPIKCSFGFVNNIKSNFNRFTPKQKSVLAVLLQRPNTDTSFVTPSGKFRIHFNKKGSNAPGYDLKEFAIAADSSYNYEVNIMKFPAPQSDNGEGGDNRIDVYLQNLVGGDYGYTEQDLVGATTSPSYIVMDNDFSGSGYYTHGINAAKVTIAHELHHVIQLGNYIFRESDRFYHELTSTAMEEFVYDDVNDYYNYIGSYFRNTGKAIAMNNGYNLALWNIFLSNRFGNKIIKDIWEEMPNMRAVEAFSKVLLDYGSSLKVEFNRFGLWCYFTNTRAVPGKYFEEAANYPLVTNSMSMDILKPISVTTEPVSNNFYEFIDGSNRLISIISNVDVQSSVNSPTTKILLDYAISAVAISGYRKLTNDYYSKITSQDLNLLAETNVLNDIPLNEGEASVETAGYAYPQPFKYSEHQYLFLPASLNGGGGNVDLYIYSTDMNLVYSGQKRIVATEKIVVPWDAKDSNQHKLATGVYFYVIKCGEDILKGKFVIYND